MHLQTSNSAFAENNALQIESDKRFGTTASQLQFARNQMTNLSISVGNILIPGLIKLVDRLKPVVLWLEKLTEEHPTLVKNVALASVALLGLAGLLLGIGIAAKTVSFAMGALAIITKLYTAAVWLNNKGLIALRIQMLAAADSYQGCNSGAMAP